MAIKMRVLHYSKKGKMATFANAIAQKYELEINKVDAIPPAYSCDKERIVILALTAKGAHLDDSLRLFCQELTKVRAQNIALMIDGNEAAANAVKKVLAEVAQNNAVYDEVLYINGGLPLFGGSVKPEEKTAIIEWVDRVIANLK